MEAHEKVKLAMQMAQLAHRGQVRKWTGAPYFEHLAQVVGLVSGAMVGGLVTNSGTDGNLTKERIYETLCAAWLHDSIEDGVLTKSAITGIFGGNVTSMVVALTDVKGSGTRAEVKQDSLLRISGACDGVKTIKVADMISNLPGIIRNDPVFAKEVYVPEKRRLLNIIRTNCDQTLVGMAEDLLDTDLSGATKKEHQEWSKTLQTKKA